MGLQMTGSCVVVQHGREAILRRGDLVIYDSTSPFLISDVDGIRQHKFRIPLDRLALPADVVRRVCAVAESGASDHRSGRYLFPPAGVAARTVRSAGRRPGERTQH